MSKKNNHWDHKKWKNYFKQEVGITVGEINQMLERLKEEDFFFISSIEIISKRFLSSVFGENVFNKSFEEILKLSVSLIGDEELLEDFPRTEDKFYSFIADEYLHIIKEPRQVLLKLYLEASEDFKIIGDNLLKIESKIMNENNFSSRGENYLSSRHKYEIDKLEYYERKNNEAKEAILNFLANDIKSYAYSECSKFSRFFQSSPYSFSRRNPFFSRRNRDSYNPDNFSILENKFLHLGIKKCDRIISEYNNAKLNDSELVKFSIKYIEEHDLIEDFHSKIEKNHILQKRKELLIKIIMHYRNSDHLSVYYMTPPQIEGIFYDYCIEIGIPEKEIHKSSISSKLEKLRAKSNINIIYEYFAFYFPVLRNKVAHGAILHDDYEYCATMLILDLFSVCDMAFSENFEINKSLSLITTIIELNFPEDLYSWIDFLHIEHPPLYQLDDKISQILKLYESDEFWSFILKKYQTDDSDYVRKKVIKLKKKKIAVGKCEEFLKNE